jgi:hypothetical protein
MDERLDPMLRAVATTRTDPSCTEKSVNPSTNVDGQQSRTSTTPAL